MRALCLLLAVLTGALAQVQPPPEIGELPPGMKPRRDNVAPPQDLNATLREVNAKSIVIVADDQRVITVHLDGKSKFERATVQPGDTVFVRATVKDGTWTAVEIRFVQKGVPPKGAPDSPREVRTATVVLPPDADARPRLTRGRPAPLPSTLDPEPALSPAPAKAKPAALPAAPPAGDPFLERARQAAASYVSTLPNFIAKQFTTRYEREPKGQFQPKDQIECEVVVENGEEQYRNFKKGGRSIKDPGSEGTWSAGEFRSLQSMVLDNNAAVFFNKAKETIARREAIRYQFSVRKEASQWRVQAVSQTYLPAYSGTIWIDAETARVLRLELESRDIPEGFPIAKTETALDYDFVRLGSQTHLLPAAAAVLACETTTKLCTKNEIAFRHYRAFGAESKITFEEK